jgi:hypothetical protein
MRISTAPDDLLRYYRRAFSSAAFDPWSQRAMFLGPHHMMTFSNVPTMFWLYNI